MCYKLFEKYRKSIQNVGKILDFEPKTPQKVLNFLAEPSNKSYLVKNIRKEFNKTFEMYLILSQNNSKNTQILRKCSQSVFFWLKTFEKNRISTQYI